MSRVEKSVFVSYRRTNSFHALAVYQDLTRNGFDVFMDYRGIDSGSFERVILENITSRTHFVVILTPSALERCDEPGDWLRREIEYALENKRNIVPLMFDDFSFSTPSIARYLTGKLELLKAYNAQRVPADFFDEAMERVRTRFLNVAVDAVMHPRSSEAEAAVEREQRAAAAQPAVSAEALTAEAWFERGLAAGTPEDKIHAYTQALTLKPGSPEPYLNRGGVYNTLQRYDDALRDFNEAIRLKPDYALAYNNRGNVYDKLQRYDDAFHDYDEAIRLKPDSADTYYNRGGTYYILKQYDDALRDFNEAIRLKPDYVNAYNNRGNVYNILQRYDDALRDYSEAIRLKPSHMSAYYNRGNVYNTLQRYDDALRDFSEAIRLEPNYIDAYYNRAVLCVELNRIHDAIADYQRYLDLGGGLRDGDQAAVEQQIRELRAKL
jgi:tetratricopeptide (TPR) repeat protein